MSLTVCLFVPSLLRNGEPQRAEILRDDSPWDEEGFRLKNIRIRQTVSRKIKKNLSVYKHHLEFSEASERRNHSEVLYLNLSKKTTTCVMNYKGENALYLNLT